MARFAIPGSVARVTEPGGHWIDHILRGSPGGTDFPDGYGTPMCAMQSGVVVLVDNNPSGSGGRTIKIRHAPGDYTELFHAHWIDARAGQTVALRQRVGRSGASGFGIDHYYGPHIHGHGVTADGRRFDVEPLIDFSNPTRPAGGGSSGGIEPRKARPPMRETQFYQMLDAAGGDVADWSRVGADVLPIGNFPGGYEATADIEVARAWGRQIQGPDYRPVKLERSKYIAAQQAGNADYRAHRADDIARIREALSVPPQFDTEALAASLAERLAPQLGTSADEVAALLRPEFERINQNIDDQPTEWTIAPKA